MASARKSFDVGGGRMSMCAAKNEVLGREDIHIRPSFAKREAYIHHVPYRGLSAVSQLYEEANNLRLLPRVHIGVVELEELFSPRLLQKKLRRYIAERSGHFAEP